MGNRSKRPMPPRLERARWAEYERWNQTAEHFPWLTTFILTYVALFLGGLYHAF